MINKLVKVRTIIFTEACPLDCRYCNLRLGDAFGTTPGLTKEELFHLVEVFDKTDNPETIDTRILFSGGEPLLRWEWIKEIINKYQNRFSYSFNTSGYLFTEEMLEFLSHYQVNFVLSIDGDEALTNYLRPVGSNPYKIGYMKTLKKILPTFLYYYPGTPFRIIINARYVDLLYQMYQFANEQGFSYFTFLIDFGHREYNRPNENKPINYLKWEDKHTKILEQQLELIVKDILMGYKYDIKRTQLVEFNKILSFLFNTKEFTPENMECQLFNERSLSSLYNEDINSYCLKKDFPNIKELRTKVIEQYEQLNHKCLLDDNCPLLDYCGMNCCIQNGFFKSGQFFDFDELECIVVKSCYKAILKFLAVGNDVCQDSFLYRQFILDTMGSGGIDNEYS